MDYSAARNMCMDMKQYVNVLILVLSAIIIKIFWMFLILKKICKNFKTFICYVWFIKISQAFFYYVRKINLETIFSFLFIHIYSYIVCIGLVESLVKRIDKVHESIENQTSLVLSLLASLGLLTKLVEICPKGV